MVKIVVVEDDKVFQDKVKSVISKIIFKSNEDIKVEYYKKLDKNLEKTIDDNSIRKIYIMDIGLENGISGIQIAKKIRENDWESEIVFITSYDKMFETVYRSVYEVFDFIEKCHNMDERLEEDLNVIFSKNFDNKMFIYSNRFFDLKIYYRSILYIYREKDERKLVIVTENNRFKVGLTIPEMLEKLDGRFKQCHRACIVNRSRVHKYDWNKGTFTLDTKENVDMLSKKYKKEVLDE